MRKLALMAVLLAAIAPTGALADNPREFLRDALEGANSEIMLGQMAASQARSPAVREFGRVLVADHSMARDQIVSLARHYGVRPTREASDEARDERARLMRLRGREFDREFVNYMVDDHRKDIDHFRDQAQEMQGPVSEFARGQLPALRRHLEMARSLDRSDGRSSDLGGHGWGNRDEAVNYRDRGWNDRDR